MKAVLCKELGIAGEAGCRRGAVAEGGAGTGCRQRESLPGQFSPNTLIIQGSISFSRATGSPWRRSLRRRQRKLERVCPGSSRRSGDRVQYLGRISRRKSRLMLNVHSHAIRNGLHTGLRHSCLPTARLSRPKGSRRPQGPRNIAGAGGGGRVGLAAIQLGKRWAKVIAAASNYANCRSANRTAPLRDSLRHRGPAGKDQGHHCGQGVDVVYDPVADRTRAGLARHGVERPLSGVAAAGDFPRCR